jgi:hypothetical protein
MSVTIDSPAPPGISKPEPNPDQPMLEQVRGLQAAMVGIVKERDLAVLLAALQGRLSRAYRRDRDGLLMANRGLQADLDAAHVRQRFTAAQTDALTREIVDLQADRRHLLAQIQDLQVANERLQRQAAAQAAEAAERPARGRWRR